MKELDLRQAFCEVITGFMMILLLLPLLDLAGIVTPAVVLQWVIAHSSLTTIIGLLAICYFFGIVGDGIGFAVDEAGFDKWLYPNEPTAEQRNAFWRSASAHVLQYRDTQWAYYECYRNLVLFIPCALLLWAPALWEVASRTQWLMLVVASFVLEVVLIYAMKSLLKLYYTITNAFAPGFQSAAPVQGAAPPETGAIAPATLPAAGGD
jgi:hypothetical protein